MNIILKNKIKSSIRNIRQNKIYKLYSINSLRLFRNKSFKNTKIVLLQIPTKGYKFISKLKKSLFFCILCGCIFYYLDNYKIFSIQNEFNLDLEQISKQFIYNILTSQDIKSAGVELVDNVFNNKYSLEATNILLKDLLESPVILQETKNYGVSLFERILNEEEFVSECEKISTDLLKNEEIKNEGVEIMRYIINKRESQDIIAQYFKVIFLRKEMIKSFTSIITNGVVYSMNVNDTKIKFNEFLVDIWSDPNLRWSIIKKSINL